MNLLLIVIQWLHVFLGIFWFGAALYSAAVIFPAMNRLPLDTQREVGAQIGSIAGRIMGPVAAAVIVLGMLRGTVFGPIQSVDALLTPYGITWLVALVLGTATFCWGKFVIEPALHALNDVRPNVDGTLSAASLAAVARVKMVVVAELGFFLAIFTCMILMRFGL